MNRRQADAVVGVLVTAVLVFGGILAWQATQPRAGGHMMDSMMGSRATGTNGLWLALGAVLVAAVVGGVYLIVRDDITETAGSDREVADATDAPVDTGTTVDPADQPRARVLDLLPDDERRILEPVLESPGLTQIELRDRADFSKSKVSQTVSALEKRGLLYREPQGRTYRIYPGDEIAEDEE
jgi:DNA-binding transcriptional ArsR family regulator